MKVKRFFAESMQAALRQVREELGAEAVILSNTRVEGGLEVVAALDYEESKAKEAVSQMRARESRAGENQASAGLVARMHAERQLKLKKEMEQSRRKIEAVRSDRAMQGASQSKLVPPQTDVVIKTRKTTFNGIETLLNPEMKARLQNHLARQASVASAPKAARPIPERAAVEKTAPEKRVFERAAQERIVVEDVPVLRKPVFMPHMDNKSRDSIPKTAVKPQAEIKPLVSPRQDIPRPVPATSHRKRNEWDAVADMREEILSLKEMIKHTQGERREVPTADNRSGVMQALGKRLSSMSLIGGVREALLKAANGAEDFEGAWALARTKLECMIKLEAGEVIDKPGVVALLGPTGNGKTMTIGKMASRYVMKYGADSIALVTMDRYRIAAHEQLKVFGRILNVPVFAVSEGNGLDAILDKLSSKRLVLVDTAGLLHSDSGWSDQMKELKMSRHKIKPYLVLSAVGQYQVMCAQYNYYRMAALEGVMLTKLDEAVSMGELISFLAASKLPAAYMSDGQRVPADLHRVDKKALIGRAVDLLNTSERWINIDGEIERDDLEFGSGHDERERDEFESAGIDAKSDKYLFHSA